MMRPLVIASLALVFTGGESEVAPPAPVDAYASFSVLVNGLDVPLSMLALGVAPRGEVDIQPGVRAGNDLRVAAGSGRLRRAGPQRWSWRAPAQPGFHEVVVTDPIEADTITLSFMVYRDASEVRDGRLNGYRIGAYRARPASMSRAYEPPMGFVEAFPADYDRRVSPNFRLRDFLCKDPGEPRYLLVSPRLLIKLEALLVAVNEAGYPTASLTVMSGFRTPGYNRAIGNTTDYSRHLWGDAADVFVDTDGDGQMDDVNRDGVSDVRDARWLAGVVEEMMAREGSPRAGGLSVYRRNAAHGPFVHVDARGSRARW